MKSWASRTAPATTFQSGRPVDPDAHPTLVTDVRRSEELHRILLDERFLQTGGTASQTAM
jgi:hypothetical protein